MSLLFLLSILVVFLVAGIEFAGWRLLKEKKEVIVAEPVNWPRVAVLIAARNEAHTLPRCLAALHMLKYPPGRLTVWIGNDGSEDETLKIARELCSQNTNWNVLNIQQKWGQVRGKANVLAQLAQAARAHADYYFLTDADIAVSPDWIKHMLPYFTPGIALVNGTTLVEENSWFARMQAFEWVKGQAMLKAFGNLPKIGKTLTAMGNNMAIDRKAYEAVGGYENIPFSVTEDFELNKQLSKKGYQSLHITSQATKAFTLPLQSLGALLQQRKRWMSGAMQLPFAMVSILFIQVLYFPAILVCLYYSPFFGGTFLIIKLLMQAFFIRQLLLRLQEPLAFPLIGFEIYSCVIGISQAIFYFLPIPLRWRGRRY